MHSSARTKLTLPQIPRATASSTIAQDRRTERGERGSIASEVTLDDRLTAEVDPDADPVDLDHALARCLLAIVRADSEADNEA